MDVYTTCYRHQNEIDVLMNKTHIHNNYDRLSLSTVELIGLLLFVWWLFGLFPQEPRLQEDPQEPSPVPLQDDSGSLLFDFGVRGCLALNGIRRTLLLSVVRGAEGAIRHDVRQACRRRSRRPLAREVLGHRLEASPQELAGIRIDPPISVPVARGVIPAAQAAAAPARASPRQRAASP